MWRKIRYSLRFLKVYTFRYRSLILGGLLLGIAGFWVIPRIEVRIPKQRLVKSIGLVGRINESNLPNEILENVSVGLTQIDEQGQVSLGLAKKWEVDENGKIWTFELDDLMTWSDNSQIIPQDLNYNFKDVSIEYPSEKQIKFVLKDAFSPFPSVLSNPVLRKDFVGIGPYKFTSFTRAGSYYKSIELLPVSKETTLPKLKYIFYGTEESAKIAFKLGEISEIYELLQVEMFENWPNVKIDKQEKPNRYVGLFFNLGKQEFKEKSARQALAYAIKDKTFEKYKRVISPIMENSWAFNSLVKPYEHDLKRAQTLLPPKNDDTEAEKDTIELSTVPSLLPIAEKIKIDWDEFGMSTTVRVVNSVPDDFDVLLVTQEVPVDPDQYALWHSTQQTNLTKYQNPKVDKLLEDGRKELNQVDRKNIYLEFQKTLLEDLPVIFLFQPVTYRVVRN